MYTLCFPFYPSLFLIFVEMDISELKAITIAEFLQRLGYTPVAKRGLRWTYFAPYRQEHKPSFRLNT